MVTLFVVLLGALSGIAYATGFTIVGLEVDDDTRGRVFAFFQSTIQVILLAVIAVVPFLSAGFTKLIAGAHRVRGRQVRARHLHLGRAERGHPAGRGAGRVPSASSPTGRWTTARACRCGRTCWPRSAASRSRRCQRGARQRARAPPPAAAGLLIAFEGGEGSGKTTQARLISIWLRELGYDVVTTHEPGATKVGMRLRALLLDTAHTGMSPHAEALMYAADRAEHVASVIDARAGPGRDRHHRPVRGLLARLPGRGPEAAGRGDRPVQLVGDRRARARPDHPAGHGPDGRAAAGARVRRTGWRPSPPSSTGGSGPGSWPWPSAEPGRYLVLDADRPPERDHPGDPGPDPRHAPRPGAPRWPRRPPATSPRSRRIR